MAIFLLIVTIVTDIILVLIAVRAISLMRQIQTRFAKLQALIVILLCVAGLIASIQDVGIHLIRIGWLSVTVGGAFVNVAQALLVIGALALLAPILVILGRLTNEFAKTEVIASTIVNRLPEGLSIETAGLTKRELEVVGVVGSGYVSDREIADQLTISAATAATHIRNIMRKTGVKRRADLALLSLELTKGSGDR